MRARRLWLGEANIIEHALQFLQATHLSNGVVSAVGLKILYRRHLRGTTTMDERQDDGQSWGASYCKIVDGFIHLACGTEREACAHAQSDKSDREQSLRGMHPKQVVMQRSVPCCCCCCSLCVILSVILSVIFSVIFSVMLTRSSNMQVVSLEGERHADELSCVCSSVWRRPPNPAGGPIMIMRP